MWQRLIDNLPKAIGASAALSPVHRERFLVYFMGLYRTFDVNALLSDDTEVDPHQLSSFAAWDDTAGEYDESAFLTLLRETRDCLRQREFNAFPAIDVGIDFDEMDAATQSIEFARASNTVIDTTARKPTLSQ